MSQRQWKKGGYEKGYSWRFFHEGHSWWVGLFVTLLVTGVGSFFYIWYRRSGNDIAPDSIVGFSYAIAGTVCFVLAATAYAVCRRSSKRAMGQLNAALNWHVFFAIMGISLLFMHSFGNFNAKTGTYALYSLIALMVSGFVGRVLDRLMPRLIAGEVDKILTAEGEDRIEIISRKLQGVVMHPPALTQRQDLSSLALSSSGPFEVDDRAMGMPWDLAYVSFEAAPQEASDGNFLHDRSVHPGVLMYQAQQQVAEMEDVQEAIEREQFYRYILRYWRLFHVVLALFTIGMIIWHLVYVAQLVMAPLLR